MTPRTAFWILIVFAMVLAFQQDADAWLPNPPLPCSDELVKEVQAIEAKKEHIAAEDIKRIKEIINDSSCMGSGASEVLGKIYEIFSRKTAREAGAAIVNTLYAPDSIDTYFATECSFSYYGVEKTLTLTDKNYRSEIPRPPGYKITLPVLPLPAYIVQNRKIITLIAQNLSHYRVPCFYYILPDSYKQDREFTLEVCKSATRLATTFITDFDVAPLLPEALKKDPEVVSVCTRKIKSMARDPNEPLLPI